MPAAAGLETGISGMVRGAEVSAVVVVVGASAAFVAASVEGVWAEAAFGGAGTVAPAGSGAES